MFPSGIVLFLLLSVAFVSPASFKHWKCTYHQSSLFSLRWDAYISYNYAERLLCTHCFLVPSNLYSLHRSGIHALWDASLDMILVGNRMPLLVGLKRMEQLVCSGQWNHLNIMRRTISLMHDGR